MRISDGVQTCALPIFQRGVGHGVEGLFDRWINVQRAKNVNMCVDRAGRHFERGTFQRVRWTGWVSNQRSEEHTSELQSLMRNSYAVFCLKKKNQQSTLVNHTI